jgi:hypothetical protein
VNVEKAVAAGVGVLGTLILVAALGAGYLAGHSSSARAGATTPTTAAPVKATLGAIISADSVSRSAIFGDGSGVSWTITSPSTTTTGNTITVTPTGGTGVVTAAIFGD